MLASLTIIQKVHKSLSLQTKNEHIYDLWHQTLEHTTTWVLLVDWGPTQNHLLLTNMFLESKINCFVSESHEVPVCCHLEKCPLEHLQNQNLLGTKAAPCGQTFCTEHRSFLSIRELTRHQGTSSRTQNMHVLTVPAGQAGKGNKTLSKQHTGIVLISSERFKATVE